MGKFRDCRQQAWQQGPQIIDNHFPYAADLKDGVCYGACMAWLQRLRTQPHEGVAGRLAHLTDQGKLIGGRQRIYQSAKADAPSDLSAQQHFELMSQLQAAGLLRMSYQFLDGGASFTDMAAAVDVLLDDGTVDYVLINVSTSSGGHAVAIQIGPTSRLFDPNFGEFAIPRADLASFFSDYQEATMYAGSMYLVANVAKVNFD